jgi:hypothetical protein
MTFPLFHQLELSSKIIHRLRLGRRMLPLPLHTAPVTTALFLETLPFLSPFLALRFHASLGSNSADTDTVMVP